MIISEEGTPFGWLYVGNETERYLLGQPGERNIVIIGINPSTATPLSPDKTISTVKNVVSSSGCDGWIMINVYPKRATNPDSLSQTFDNALSEKNMNLITKIKSDYNLSTVWCAWGDSIYKRKYLKDELDKIHDILSDLNWVHRGSLNKSGSPHHPLYQGSSLQFEKFDIKEYLQTF